MEFTYSHLLQNSIHVEVCLSEYCSAKSQEVNDAVLSLLQTKENIRLSLLQGNSIDIPPDNEFLTKNVKGIIVYCEPKVHLNAPQSTVTTFFNPSSQQANIHIYQLNEDQASEEMEESDTPACQQWILPHKEFHGVWDSLIFDGEIKNDLLDYVSSTMLFSDKKVNSTIVSWNRVILLHGPPGTGKTSLCKALAQKLSIRLSTRYSQGQLVEINAHSLFSKWFSESGKLVLKMFQYIKELIEDQNSCICVLIDEVESLTAARKAALSGNEPSDAIRVVNALLTQIDQLKNYNNVIILATSNITGAIDLAFVDRADIKQYIGPPSAAACYHILTSCINELMRVGIISPQQSLLDYKTIEHFKDSQTEVTRSSVILQETSKRCEGLSGRVLRKLPFLAHAFFIQKEVINLEDFIMALNLAIDKELHGRATMEK